MGRKRGLMKFADGTCCWPRLGVLIRDLDPTGLVDQFQVVQFDFDKILISIKAKRHLGINANQNVSDLILKQTGRRFETYVEYYSGISLSSPQSKFEEFICLV